MNKISIALALAGSVALAACGTTVGTVTLPTVKQVQASVAAACAYVPSATTVADIIAAATPAGPTGTAVVNTVSSITSAICAAVATAPQSLNRFGVAPTPVVVINGKVIQVTGTFIAK